MTEKENNSTAMVGALMLIAGGIVGAGVALLLAPQSGKATRRYIARCARKTGQAAEGVVDEFTDTVSSMVETITEKASEIVDQGKEMTHDAQQNLLKTIEEGQEKLEKQRRRLAKLFT